MQQLINEQKYQTGYYPRSYLLRCAAALTAVLGGLTLILTAGRWVSTQLSVWSPTATARRCFDYPEEAALPDSQAVSQFLLSQAFFGNDALYFDSGEENTGIASLPQIQPDDRPGAETPQNALDEPQALIPADTDIYAFDRSSVPTGQLALVPYDLTQNAASGQVLFSNTTAYEISAVEALERDYPITAYLRKWGEDTAVMAQTEPLVLILHTHGTEAFAPEGATSVSPNTSMRSSDITENIVAVGEVMADLLNEAGIPTIHCEIMHDLESYQNSYNLAADTIQKYLTEYPSIRYVFDVHRDAISRTNGDLIKPVTNINGRLAAQIMLLVGTDEKGADHPLWKDNLTVAVSLQEKLTSSYSRFARPINIRGASFNEQFAPGSLLIEIGSAGNTLAEAKTAAEYLTYSLIDLIRENSK